jgi:hypothetical protein
LELEDVNPRHSRLYPRLGKWVAFVSFRTIPFPITLPMPFPILLSTLISMLMSSPLSGVHSHWSPCSLPIYLLDHKLR